MKISVFGLGYVGCVSAACLAKEGHDVIGVDPNPTKVDLLNQGKSPIIEKNLDQILEQVVTNRQGNLTATNIGPKAVVETDVSLICVGTPSRNNGSLNLDHVQHCAKELGSGLKYKNAYHVFAARSTMLPGTLENIIIREIEFWSGKKSGRDFGAVMNPEFLRESTSIDDFYNPSVTVIGELDQQSGDTIEKMYHFLKSQCHRTDIRTAEMIKYANNAFHALKVAFANEIGAISKQFGIDSHKVMDIFCMDNKLNLSSYYLKPGFAFGGSCLPKDLRAITYAAKQSDVELPLLHSVITSNETHIQRAIQYILDNGYKKVGILGLSFKAGTDDLRESPLVVLTEALIGKGYDIKILDKNISLAKIFGANKDYIEKEIPHISSLMVENVEDLVEHADVIIVGNKSSEFGESLENLPKDKRVLDLVRMYPSCTTHANYEGICW